jgi:putative addiction module component (TIGR02574 family)
MKTTVEEITRVALALGIDEQEALAQKLVGNMVAQVSATTKRRQLTEVRQRREEILSGKVQGVTVEEVVREIQALVR